MRIDLSRPGDSHETLLYKQRLLQSMLPAPFVMAVSGTVVWWLGLPMCATAMWIFGTGISILAAALIILKNYEVIIAGIMLYFGVIFSMVVTILFGGILKSGGVVFVGLAAAMFSMSFLPRRHTHTLFGMYFLFILVAPFVQPWLVPIEVFPARINLILFTLHILVVAVNIYAIISRYLEESVRQKAREAEQWRSLDTMKSRFYANISHEFRTPLTVILGMAEQISRQPEEMLTSGIEAIRRNGQRLLHLVNQMLDLARLESGSIRLHPVRDDVLRFFRYLLEPQARLAEEKNVRLSLDLPPTAFVMDFDPERLETVVVNLVSNAIRHAPAGSDVRIRVRTGMGLIPEFEDYFVLFGERHFDPGREVLMISVRDRGKGIVAEEIPLIFERFYQSEGSHPSSPGTGIGLALVRDLVGLMEGQLLVKSQAGAGSEFCVILPVRREAKQGNSYVGTAGDGNLIPADFQDFQPNGEKRELLIIEDNLDIAEYLSGLLARDYVIKIAANGEQGIEQAQTTLPDLIISDIMMPEKDGYEVCEVLKNDVRTSHIPVILLTARADRESRIRGLESGADAFLVKPFDHRELEIRLQKLWQLREVLQQKYRTMALSHIDQQLPENQDTIFLGQVKALMEAHLDDEGFDVHHMAESLQISRTQLYRKIKALTGHSASELLRSLRLNRARELLLHTDFNISEIGYEVGYRDPAYFSRAFSREFGMSPSAVREQAYGA